jgi:N-hydroxyarylamine O-acetyltransferase
MSYDHAMRLDAYLSRLGLSPPLPPTVETLRKVHVAHLAAFPFDNLEIQRHGTVRTDLESVEQKFLSGTTGGYCFEQNTLLGGALAALGFDVSTILGRVGTPDHRTLNHLVLRVEIDGEGWLADVGFGGQGLLEPMPIVDGATVVQDGLTYSIRRNGHYWMLSMHCGEESEELYDFGDVPHTPADIEMANYYTATHPSSVFRRTLTIQRARPGDRVILRTTMVTRYQNGVRTDTPIDPSQVRAYARELFGIDLGEAPLLFESQPL